MANCPYQQQKASPIRDAHRSVTIFGVDHIAIEVQRVVRNCLLEFSTRNLVRRQVFGVLVIPIELDSDQNSMYHDVYTSANLFALRASKTDKPGTAGD